MEWETLASLHIDTGQTAVRLTCGESREHVSQWWAGYHGEGAAYETKILEVF